MKRGWEGALNMCVVDAGFCRARREIGLKFLKRSGVGVFTRKRGLGCRRSLAETRGIGCRGRDEWPVGVGSKPGCEFDGDKSPRKSGENSPHPIGAADGVSASGFGAAVCGVDRGLISLVAWEGDAVTFGRFHRQFL